MKKLLSILLAVVLAACSLSLAVAEPADAPTKEHWGMDLSGLNTTDIDGNPVTAEIFKNADITFLNMWSVYCGPCVAEMPDIQKAYEKYSATPEEDVQIIGIPCTGLGATIPEDLAYLEEMNYTYPQIFLDSVLSSAINSGYIPETLIVDRNGIVRDDVIGAFSGSMLEKYLDRWVEVVNHEDTECTITFVNGVTNEVIGTQTARYGYSFSANYPAAPTVEGYNFDKWTINDGVGMDEWAFNGGSCYMAGYDDTTLIPFGDVTVTANYVPMKFKVKFYDNFDGGKKLLNIQQVEYGKGATAPQPPEHEGFVFYGWDKEFDHITGDTDIYTIWVAEGEEPPVTTPPVDDPTPTPPADDPTPTPPVTNPGGLGEPGSGDMDGDGEASVSDALNIARIAMEINMGSDAEKAVADCNGDDKVDMSDALYIIRVAMKVIE